MKTLANIFTLSMLILAKIAHSQNGCPIIFTTTNNYTLTAGQQAYSSNNPVAVRPAHSVDTPIATFYDGCELYSTDTSSSLFDTHNTLIAYTQKNTIYLNLVDCNQNIFASLERGPFTLLVNNATITVLYKIYDRTQVLIGYLQTVDSTTNTLIDPYGNLIAQASQYQTPQFQYAQSEWLITFQTPYNEKFAITDPRIPPLIISDKQLTELFPSPCSKQRKDGMTAGIVLGSALVAGLLFAYLFKKGCLACCCICCQ